MSAVHFEEVAPSGRPIRQSIYGAIAHGSVRRTFGIYLMYIVLCEAAVLGSGQMVHLGPLTLKMVLFIVSMLYLAVSILSGEQLSAPVLILTISYLGFLLSGSLLGLSRGAEPAVIERDLSPLMAMLYLPFFELTIRDLWKVRIIARILMVAAVVISVGYLLAVALLWSGRISFGEVASWLSNIGNSTAGNQDFMFDEATGRIFYKGALYIVIAIAFFLFRRGWKNKLIVLLLVPSLLVIGTRGFFVGIFITGLLYIIISPSQILKKSALILTVILAGSFLLSVLFLRAGNRATESDSTRIATIQQALDRSNPLSVVFGNGLGIGVPMRTEHMEISYLEIFYKQGILGLCWWGAAFLFLTAQFRRALKCGQSRLAYPFFLSAVFIAIESLTNPYINNPIGLTFLTSAAICLGVLGRADRPMSYDPL